MGVAMAADPVDHEGFQLGSEANVRIGSIRTSLGLEIQGCYMRKILMLAL